MVDVSGQTKMMPVVLAGGAHIELTRLGADGGLKKRLPLIGQELLRAPE